MVIAFGTKLFIFMFTRFFKSTITYPLGSKKVVIERPKSLPCIIAAIGSAHEVFDDQSDVNQADAVIRRKVTLNKIRLLRVTPNDSQHSWLTK